MHSASQIFTISSFMSSSAMALMLVRLLYRKCGLIRDWVACSLARVSSLRRSRTSRDVERSLSYMPRTELHRMESSRMLLSAEVRLTFFSSSTRSMVIFLVAAVSFCRGTVNLLEM